MWMWLFVIELLLLMHECSSEQSRRQLIYAKREIDRHDYKLMVDWSMGSIRVVFSAFSLESVLSPEINDLWFIFVRNVYAHLCIVCEL